MKYALEFFAGAGIVFTCVLILLVWDIVQSIRNTR